MASTSIRRAETDPNNGSATTATFSVWFKRSKVGSYQTIYNHRYSNSYEFKFMMYNDDRLYLICTRSSTVLEFLTSRKFRDVNGWYHLVIAVDSSQATESNRVKIYVNGVQETAFDTATYPSQDANLNLDGGNSYYNNIGSRGDGSSEYWDGSMAYFAKIDGTQELPTIFGSTDTTTGEWKIKTSITPSSSWGNKPFFILKDGNSLTDQSGSSKDFSSHQGTLTKTEDCPSNVFCTVNELDNYFTNTTLYNGNTQIDFNNGWAFNTGTLGFNSGKWYWEVRSNNWSAGNQAYGITSAIADGTGDEFYNNSGAGAGYGLYNNGVIYGNGSVQGSGYTSSGTPYIGMIAVDADNNQIWFGANGSWETGSGPGSTGVSIAALSTQTSGFWFPAFSGGVSSSGNNFQINFGNGYFGTTAVSSAGTNASNLGIFEYDVPTGYSALCTKGLNE